MSNEQRWPMPVEERYRNDLAFRTLVDVIEATLHDSHFTPTEVREAAVMACVNFENRQIRHKYIIPLRAMDMR